MDADAANLIKFKYIFETICLRASIYSWKRSQVEFDRNSSDFNCIKLYRVM